LAPSDTIVSVAKNLVKLEQTVMRMVLEGLGAREERIHAHLDQEALTYSLRLWRYGMPLDAATGVSLLPHRDTWITSTVLQHEVEGLEVQTRDGNWIAVPPEPDTATIIAGDFFTVSAFPGSLISTTPSTSVKKEI
jgi:isopenicillin N synthase-like dioxygenase